MVLSLAFYLCFSSAQLFLFLYFSSPIRIFPYFSSFSEMFLESQNDKKNVTKNKNIFTPGEAEGNDNFRVERFSMYTTLGSADR